MAVVQYVIICRAITAKYCSFHCQIAEDILRVQIRLAALQLSPHIKTHIVQEIATSNNL